MTQIDSSAVAKFTGKVVRVKPAYFDWFKMKVPNGEIKFNGELLRVSRVDPWAGDGEGACVRVEWDDPEQPDKVHNRWIPERFLEVAGPDEGKIRNRIAKIEAEIQRLRGELSSLYEQLSED